MIYPGARARETYRDAIRSVAGERGHGNLVQVDLHGNVYFGCHECWRRIYLDTQWHRDAEGRHVLECHCGARVALGWKPEISDRWRRSHGRLLGIGRR